MLHAGECRTVLIVNLSALLCCRYQLNVSGVATAGPAPPGATTTGPVPQVARLQVCLRLKDDATSASSTAVYESVDAALDDAAALASKCMAVV